MAYKHIIWDWNGTLLNDNWLSIKSINTLLVKYDLPEIELKKYREIFTFPVIEYYKKLGFDFSKDPFSKVGTEFIHEYTARMYEPMLHSNSLEILEMIRQNKLTQSILSASKLQLLEPLMDHHRIHSFFMRVIGLDNHYAHSKLTVGKEWIEELGHDNHEVLFIGDTLHDFDVGQGMSIDTILISHGHTSHARLMKAGVPVFRSFSELGSWLSDKIT